jgi:hypothetical protein
MGEGMDELGMSLGRRVSSELELCLGGSACFLDVLGTASENIASAEHIESEGEEKTRVTTHILVRSARSAKRTEGPISHFSIPLARPDNKRQQTTHLSTSSPPSPPSPCRAASPTDPPYPPSPLAFPIGSEDPPEGRR